MISNLFPPLRDFDAWDDYEFIPKLLAMRISGLSSSALDRAIAKDRIDSKRVKGLRLISRKSLQIYLDSGARERVEKRQAAIKSKRPPRPCITNLRGVKKCKRCEIAMIRDDHVEYATQLLLAAAQNITGTDAMVRVRSSLRYMRAGSSGVRCVSCDGELGQL